MSVLHVRIDQIVDEETKRLIDELELISGISVEGWREKMLLHFIQQTYHPNGGAEKPVPISMDDLDSHDPSSEFVLRKKVGKVGDPLYQVCIALAAMRGKGIEAFHGNALYVFLGKVVVKKNTRDKPKRLSEY